MKILYYHRTLADGAEGIHIREIVNSFRKMGHEVKVISILNRDESLPSETGTLQEKSLKVKIIEKLRWMLPGFFYELAEILTNFSARSLISESIRAFQPDFIYERYSNYGFVCTYLAKKYRIPIILEVNVPYYRYKKEWEKLYFPWLLRQVEHYVLKNVDHILAVSTPLKSVLLEYPIPGDKITVMPNGVNTEKFYPLHSKEQLKRALGIDAEVVLGFVGIIRKWHRMDRLIRILHEIGIKKYRAKLLIVGECNVMDDLSELINKLGQEDQIIFTGRVPHSEIPKYIEVMDVAISPYAVPYSSPMKILEYMAMGKCVIAPDMENIRDLIIPGETGLLFDPENEVDLAEKIRLTLEFPDLREKIGNNALQKVREKYTWDKNAEEVIEIFKNLTQKSGMKVLV